MPIVLGTRGRSNIIWGPAEVYIADGGTLSAISSYGNTMTKANFDTLLASFEHLGTIGKSPMIKHKPFTRDLIKAIGVHWAAAKGWLIEAEATLFETDTTLADELIGLVDANTDVDFLFVKGSAVGDHFFSFRSVPFTLESEINNQWEKIELMKLRIKGKVNNLHDAHGHYTIT